MYRIRLIMEYSTLRKLILLVIIGCSAAQHHSHHGNHRQAEHSHDAHYNNYQHVNGAHDGYHHMPEHVAGPHHGHVADHEHIANRHHEHVANHEHIDDMLDGYHNNPEHYDNHEQMHGTDGHHYNNEHREMVHEEYNRNHTKSDDCALRLNRSFAPRETNPLLDGREHHEPDTLENRDCIRYSDINRAFDEAKKKYGFILVQRPYYDMEVGKIYELGTILVETTRILAKRFQLTWKELNDELPTINMTNTDIWDICPAELKPTPCRQTRFRENNGRCSSLKNSVWGMANTPTARVLYPQYDDGIGSPKTQSVAGGPLPHVRVVSVTVHNDLSQESSRFAELFMSWAQFLGHDFTFLGVLREQNGTTLECCPRQTHPICDPIRVPANDPFYSRFSENARCMDFQRGVPSIRAGCALGPRVQMNMITTRLDGGSVYGTTGRMEKTLRKGVKGLLKMWDKFHDLGLKELLPLQTATPDNFCIRLSRKLYCFLAGDDRVNVQIGTVIFHTIHARYHNVIANQLSHLNPHWDDERLFQEAKHIHVAVLQHLAYNEMLPLLIGPRNVKRNNLTLSEGYWDGYDYNTPMVTIQPFHMAANRFAHSLVNNKMRFFDTKHEFVDSVDFHDTFFQPFMLYQPGNFDKVISGMANSASQSFDRFMTTELTQHLYIENFNESFGRDLAAVNINRGRETGMPGYNAYREWCGLPRIKTFDELEHFIGNGTGRRYAKLFKSTDDIDLWSGSLAEPNAEGAVVGETFGCIIGRQFSIYRRADHFWYENPGFPSSFTPGQLREIKKITIAKVICDNSDNVDTIQMWPFILPDERDNPRVVCKDLPSINLEHWIEDPAKKVFMHQS